MRTSAKVASPLTSYSLNSCANYPLQAKRPVAQAQHVLEQYEREYREFDFDWERLGGLARLLLDRVRERQEELQETTDVLKEKCDELMDVSRTAVDRLRRTQEYYRWGRGGLGSWYAGLVQHPSAAFSAL